MPAAAHDEAGAHRAAAAMATLATAPPAGALKNVDELLVKHVRCATRHAVPFCAVRHAPAPLPARGAAGSARAATRLRRRCGAQNRGGTAATRCNPRQARARCARQRCIAPRRALTQAPAARRRP
jgi:hypothetical protein